MSDEDFLIRMSQQAIADSERWFPDAARDLTVIALGLCGESGEFADIVKKIARGSTSVPAQLENLRFEVVDIFVYILNAADALQFDLLAYYIKKREFNENRFGREKNGHNPRTTG